VTFFTTELSDRCLSACLRELRFALSTDVGREKQTELHFPAPPELLDLLAWRVLIPFIVSVTAGSTVASLKARWIKDQPSKNLKDEATARLGHEIRLGDTNTREECILLVEELLKPYGVTRDKARKIVESMEATIDEK